MWKIIRTSTLLFTLLTTFSLRAQTNIDRIVAVVGDKIILYSDISNQLKQAQQEGANLGANPFATILEEAMFQKLLVHQADIDSLVVSEDQVEQELNSRISYFIAQIGSKEKFEEYYGKSTEKFKDDFRDIVRDRMKSQQMQSKITGDIKVTPKEVKDFFNNIPKDSLPFMGSKVEVSQLVRMPSISPEQKLKVKDELSQLRQSILKGEETFCSAALFKSKDPGTRSNCGEFDMVSRGQFVPEFDAVAFSMKEGEISEVFETPYGYHILKLLERRGDMYRGQHILLIPEVSNAQMTQEAIKLDSIYKDLKAEKITFEKAVSDYSTDKETKYNGGKIFNPQTGDTKFEINELDKQLFIVVDNMKPGEFSEPVIMTTSDQKQGLRILKLNSRSEPHIANLHDDYPQIAEASLNAKKGKTILNWVKSKVNGMYVWIADDYQNYDFEYPWIKNQ